MTPSPPAIDPLVAEAFAAFQQQDFQQAKSLLLTLSPSSAQWIDGRQLLAQSHLALNEHEKALGIFEELAPNLSQSPAFTVNYAIAYEVSGKIVSARKLYQAALAADRSHPTALFRLARLEHQSGNIAEALSLLESWSGASDHFDSALLLASLIQTARGVAASEAYWARLVELAGNQQDHLVRLSSALYEHGHFPAAIKICDKALQLNATIAPIWANKGLAWMKLGHLKDALECLERAYALDPTHQLIIQNIAHIYREIGDPGKAMAVLNKSFAHSPSETTAQARCFTASLLPDYDGPKQLHIAKEWARFLPSPRPIPSIPTPIGKRPLKLGFVSPDFRRHPAWNCWFGLLEQFRHRGHSLHLFYNNTPHDEITERWKQLADRFTVIAHLQHDRAAEIIRSQEIDILFDMGAAHTAKQNMRLFGHRPAPVQVTNAIASTGTEYFDAYLASAQYECPDNVLSSLFSEPVYRLNSEQFLFQASEESQAVTTPPFKDTGHVTFASFAKISKINDQCLEAWRNILHHLPTARLVIKSPNLRDSEVQERLLRRLDHVDMDLERVEMIGTLSREDFLSLFGRIDIGLDSFPYAGTVTNFEFLYNGIPYVAVSGRLHQSQYGALFLRWLGLNDLVARTSDEYVAAAIALAQDTQRLANLRRTLRTSCEASAFMDLSAVPAAYEKVFYQLLSHAFDRQQQRTT